MGLGSKILGGIDTASSLIPGVGGIIGGLTGIGSKIAGLFTQPAGEKSKRILEQNMRDIHNEWLSGKLDADTAIAAIKAQMGGMGEHESVDHLSMMSGFAANLIDDIVASRSSDIGSSFGSLSSPDRGRTPFGESGTSPSSDYKGGSTPAPAINERERLTGGSEFQKERGRSLMRNLLMKTQSGQDFGEATGLNRLTAAPADAGAQFDKFSGKVESPLPKTDQLGNKIRTKLNELGGY